MNKNGNSGPKSMQVMVLSAENIVKKYVSGGGDLEVLHGASISLEAGDMAVLLGDSGTGKSTLLHILATLDRPGSGHVYYAGLDAAHLKNQELAKFRNEKIGFVYQFHHLLPEFNALENVILPGLISGRSKKACDEIGLGLLANVGLGERATHYPNQLSGGESQRIAIARALFNKPEVVFADEPTGNLDLRTGDHLMDLFEKLNEKFGQTFLIATHNPRLAERGKKRFRLEGGKVKALDGN
jgi:lipoprotein-releasing system ATP-binding protein